MRRILAPVLALLLCGASTIVVAAGAPPPERPFAKTCVGPNPDGSVRPGQVDTCTITMAQGSAPANSAVTIGVVSPGFAPLASCSGTINSRYPNECTFSLPYGAAEGDVIGTESFVVPGVPSGTRVTQGALFCPVPWACQSSNVAVDGPGSMVTTTPTADPGIVLQPFEISAVEGQPFDGSVGILRDTDPRGSPFEYSATIDWGDGVVSPARFNNWSVMGSHTYAEEGTFVVTVSVRDNDNPSNRTSRQWTASVEDAALTATGHERHSTSHFADIVASFTDANPYGTASDYAATIDWGDGTNSSGTILADFPSFDVSGSHDYAALGPFTVGVHICDVGGSCADATSHFLIYGLAAGGNFVIGDGNAAIGSSVTYWGAQWVSQNSPSGGVGTAAFKGFANDPSSAPRCAVTWAASPGNSALPPDRVPSYMAVIATSAVAQRGAGITGDSPQVVIVKTDPGYGPDPGQAGTGTVVAVLCP